MDQIEKLLNCAEYILFTGEYNISERGSSIQKSTGSFVPASINLCELKNSYNIIANEYFNGSSNLINSPEFISETYNLVSYQPDPLYSSGFGKKYGLLVWTGTYPNAKTPNENTLPSVHSFDVTTQSGIYSDVKKVIIDFRDPIRKMYFIGNLFY